MNGQELYALNARASLEAQNCSVDEWEDADQPTWDRLAELIEAYEPTQDDRRLIEFAGFVTAYFPELRQFETPRMLEAIEAFNEARNERQKS